MPQTLTKQFDSARQRYSNYHAFSHLGVILKYSDWQIFFISIYLGY